MAIVCAPSPPLHIPHQSSPYNDQKLMENFQAIQRWADRLTITCTGCDCDDLGVWNITPDNITEIGATTTSYTFDIDATLGEITVEGIATEAPPMNFIVNRNGSAISTHVLPDNGGAFTETYTINQLYNSGDDITFTFEVIPSEASAQITMLEAVGFIPWTIPGAIGSGNEYIVDLITENGPDVSTTLDTDQASPSGTDADLSLPADAIPWTVTTSFAGTGLVYGYIGWGTSSGPSRDAKLTEIHVALDYTGDGSDLVWVTTEIEAPGGGGFTILSTDAISADQTLTIPANVVYTMSNPVGPTDRAIIRVTTAATSPNQVTTISDFTAGFGPDAHADEVVSWGGGG